MNELKPCPFCGKDVFLLDVATRSSANAKWDVYCRTHGCFLNSGTNNMFSNREDAFIAWNTRAESPEIATPREQVKALRDALKLSNGMLSDFLRSMPAYTEEGWGYERFDQDGEYCGFERINPDYVIQMFHELAIDVQSNLYAALEQTKPKDGE